MWTRESLKDSAKEALRGNYWKAFLVSIVLAIVTANGSSNRRNNSALKERVKDYTIFNDTFAGDIALFIGKIIAIIATIFIILVILKIFIGYMLEVGGRKYFIKLSEGESNMGYLGYCFNSESYLNVLGTMLLRSVYTFLWTLLFIIPGIIKSFSYRMVPYILADNPSIGCDRAIELSKQMTDGEKWEMFILDLSFLGWYILGLLALGVGMLFVHPYYNATYAELYLTFRRDAIISGITSYEELNLMDEEA